MLRPSPVTSWMPVERKPVLGPGSFVDESAVLIGQVIIRLSPVTSAHKEFNDKVLRVNAELLVGYLKQAVGGIILEEELLEA